MQPGYFLFLFPRCVSILCFVRLHHLYMKSNLKHNGLHSFRQYLQYSNTMPDCLINRYLNAQTEMINRARALRRLITANVVTAFRSISNQHRSKFTSISSLYPVKSFLTFVRAVVIQSTSRLIQHQFSGSSGSRNLKMQPTGS